MGKLVLFLADGTTKDLPLDRERVTIGRRADNDVCLPYPAVSGEHAQVVTILADSFLEDLGSTNGTLVNGKAVTKHFLTDHDMIDIGRQRLTYRSDDDARVDPLPPDLARSQMRGLTERVEAARALPQVEVPGANARGPQYGARGHPLLAELEREAAAADAGSSASPIPPPGAMGMARAPADVIAERVSRVVAAAAAMPQPAAARLPKLDTISDTGPLPAAPVPAGAPAVRVLSGPSIGRTVAFPNPEMTIGRVGTQVAVVRKVDGGFRLVPLEGAEPPRINGAPVAAEGSPLHPGDTFEIAGVRLELSGDS